MKTNVNYHVWMISSLHSNTTIAFVKETLQVRKWVMLRTAHTLFFLFFSHLNFIFMSSKSRDSSSPSTTANLSKLPKFFQSKQHRDRSRSMIDSNSTGSTCILEPSVPVPSSTTQAPKRYIMCRGNKLVGAKEKEKEASSPPHDADVSEDFSATDDGTGEPPIIVEPLSP
jgi:hypothetical protein